MSFVKLTDSEIFIKEIKKFYMNNDSPTIPSLNHSYADRHHHFNNFAIE